MALPSSGTISMLQVNNELGKSSTQKISLNDAEVRSLANKTSGTISMSDLYGKSSGIIVTTEYKEAGSGNNFFGFNIPSFICMVPFGSVSSQNFAGRTLCGIFCQYKYNALVTNRLVISGVDLGNTVYIKIDNKTFKLDKGGSQNGVNYYDSKDANLTSAMHVATFTLSLA